MTVAPREPLSQVVFVHDYFQLVFQSETLSIYNKASLRSKGVIFVQGEPGFADALVALIDQRAKPSQAVSGVKLALEFTSGAQLLVHSSSASQVLPEAFSFASHSGQFTVGQNE